MDMINGHGNRRDLDEFLDAVRYARRFGLRPSFSPDASAVAVAQRGVRQNELMALYLRAGSLTDRRVMHGAIARSLHLLALEYIGRATSVPRAYVLGGNLEDALARGKRRWLHIGCSVKVQRVWAFAALAITAVAAIAIVSGNLKLAAGLIATRILVSSVLPRPGLPGDAFGRSQWRVDWRMCVVGHLADGISLFAVSAYLSYHDATAWGFAVGLVPIVMLTATLLRVAAVQGGLILSRLYIERWLRNGGLLVGLILAILLQPSGPTTRFPVIVIASFGALAYSVLEITRTLMNAHWRTVRERELTDDEAFNFRTANLVRIVDEQLRSDELHYDGPFAASVAG